MERIDNHEIAAVMHPGVFVRCPKQKMAGKVDAGHLDPRPARDLEIDDGKRDRDTGAAIEHHVEEAVPGIVVSVAISSESLLVVQVLVEHADGVLAAHPRPRHAARRLLAHALQRVEVPARIERRVLDPGDRQRCRCELVAGCIDGFLEVGGDLEAPGLKMKGVSHCARILSLLIWGLPPQTPHAVARGGPFDPRSAPAARSRVRSLLTGWSANPR
jgi:hypothetical protein